MAEEKEKAEERREDSEREDAMHAKLDAIMDRLDAAHRRMDSLEEHSRKDADEDKAEREEQKEREEDEGEEEKARADRKRKDADDKRKEDGEFAKKDERRADESEEEREEVAKKEPREKDGRFDAKDEDEDEKKDSRKDGEDDRIDRKDSRRKDESFEKWAKEEEDEPEHRKDAALARENADLRRRLLAVEDRLREIPREEMEALAKAQARADSVMALFGDRAPAPRVGESQLSYRRRMAQRLKKHSPQFAKSDLALADSAILASIENQIYADAEAAARKDASEAVGTLVPWYETDMAGRRITKFHGDIMAFMKPFVRGGQAGRINRNPKVGA